jgi:hypothetical protein
VLSRCGRFSFACLSKKVRRQAATRDAKVPLGSAVASAQLSFPSLSLSQPSSLQTHLAWPTWVGNKRPRHYPPKYLSKRVRVPYQATRAISSCRHLPPSRFVLHVCSSFFHFYLCIFGIFLCILSGPVIYISDQISLLANNGGVQAPKAQPGPLHERTP